MSERFYFEGYGVCRSCRGRWVSCGSTVLGTYRDAWRTHFAECENGHVWVMRFFGDEAPPDARYVLEESRPKQRTQTIPRRPDECQKCGAPIGWLGRFFQAVLPRWAQLHECRPLPSPESGGGG